MHTLAAYAIISATVSLFVIFAGRNHQQLKRTRLVPVYTSRGAIFDYRPAHVITYRGTVYTITPTNSADVFARIAFS